MDSYGTFDDYQQESKYVLKCWPYINVVLIFGFVIGGLCLDISMISFGIHHDNITCDESINVSKLAHWIVGFGIMGLILTILCLITIFCSWCLCIKDTVNVYTYSAVVWIFMTFIMCMVGIAKIDALSEYCVIGDFDLTEMSFVTVILKLFFICISIIYLVFFKLFNV